MLAKLKKELTIKDRLVKQEKRSELKIKSQMDYDSISELIAEKLLNKIKENVC